MSEKSLTSLQWQECEALRRELSGAREELVTASHALRHSLSPKERALEFVRERPISAVLTTFVAGALAFRLLPVLLWRGPKGIIGRFTGQLARAAAGAAVPLITSRLAAHLARRREANTISFTAADVTRS